MVPRAMVINVPVKPLSTTMLLAKVPASVARLLWVNNCNVPPSSVTEPVPSPWALALASAKATLPELIKVPPLNVF